MRTWWPAPVRRVVALVFGPDPVGAAQAMAGFRASAAIGGQVIAVPQSFGGYVAPTLTAAPQLGAGRVTPNEPRGFPGTVSPTGAPVAGSAQDILWRTSGLAGSGQ